MISPVLEAKILLLHCAEGWHVGTIAGQLGLHHATVLRVLSKMTERSISGPPYITEYDGDGDSFLLRAHASAVRRVTTQHTSNRQIQTKHLALAAAYVPFIVETLTEYPSLTASVLFKMVRRRGYPGSEGHFRHVVAKYRPQIRRPCVTLPGEHAHVHWFELGDSPPCTNESPLTVFLFVLSWSRHIFVEFSQCAEMQDFVRRHVSVFSHLRGVPRVIFYHNYNSAFRGHRSDPLRPLPELTALAAHYCFQPRPVRQSTPTGVLQDALEQVRGAPFTDERWRNLDDLNRRALRWAKGTAGRLRCPEDPSLSIATAYRYERPFLVSLPKQTFILDQPSPKPKDSSERQSRTEKTEKLRMGRLITLLHDKPNAFGFNRASWTQDLLALAYQKKHGTKFSRDTVRSLLRKAGYRWRKARRVLTSPDPEYREKVERLLHTLWGLARDEMVFFIDEMGPLRVKRYGGRTYMTRHGEHSFPQRQAHKGSICLSGALSATTNQVTWIYGNSKDTLSMIDLIEILFNQYHDARRIFVTWDAASWHSSSELVTWLDDLNAGTHRVGEGPLIELIPLPRSAQFLDVIEAVFSAMKKAIIHHSDYSSEENMKAAISRSFDERNEYFKDNPKRAGRKIWEIDFFKDYDHLRAGDYREW